MLYYKGEISKSSDDDHLNQLGYVNHFDIWVPHKLREKSPLGHISTCNSLLKQKKMFCF